MNREKFGNIVQTKTGKKEINLELSRVLGVNKNTASARASGKRPLRADEIDKLRIEYEMTDSEVVECFIKEGD